MNIKTRKRYFKKGGTKKTKAKKSKTRKTKPKKNARKNRSVSSEAKKMTNNNKEVSSKNSSRTVLLNNDIVDVSSGDSSGSVIDLSSKYNIVDLPSDESYVDLVSDTEEYIKSPTQKQRVEETNFIDIEDDNIQDPHEKLKSQAIIDNAIRDALEAKTKNERSKFHEIVMDLFKKKSQILPTSPVKPNLIFSSFERLNGTTWLNDEVIDYYFKILQKKYPQNLFLPVNFIKLKPETISKFIRRNFQLPLFPTYEKIFIPFNINKNHWTLLEMQPGIVKYIDSQNNKMTGDTRKIIKDLYNSLREFMETDLKDITVVENVPQQIGNDNCGMFALLFADAISNGNGIQSIDPHAVQEKRKDIAFEILANE